MNPQDVPEAAALERQSYAHPWSEGIFRDCLRVGYQCRAIEHQGRLAGYGIMSLGSDEAHILNVCVRQDLRNRGIGRTMVESLLDYARRMGMQHAFLEVRPSNMAAVRLYQAIGFRQIGVRRGYYPAGNGREDAVVFRFDLLGSRS